MLKKTLVATALLACVFQGAQAQDLTGTLKKIKETKTIVLGHRESSVPFSYYDDKQNVIGYSQEMALKIVDAVKAELKMPDLQVKLIPITSANRITLVQNGTIDFECGSTTHNSERAKQAAFSNSIFVVGTRLLTKKNSGIKDFPDLTDKNVVSTAGTTSETLLRKMNTEKNMGMSIISAKDHGESFLTLQSGRAVAFMMDDALLYGERAKSRNPMEWDVVGKAQTYEAYACMMRKDDAPFKALVDRTLAKTMTSGEAEKMYDKWFKNPIPPKGLNLNFPLSNEMKSLYSAPSDKPFE